MESGELSAMIYSFRQKLTLRVVNLAMDQRQDMELWDHWGTT